MNIAIPDLLKVAEGHRSFWALESFIKNKARKDFIPAEKLCKFISSSFIDEQMAEAVCKAFTLYHPEIWNSLIEEFKKTVIPDCQMYANEYGKLKEFDSLSMFGINVFGIEVLYCYGYELFNVHHCVQNKNTTIADQTVFSLCQLDTENLSMHISSVQEDSDRGNLVECFKYAHASIEYHLALEYRRQKELKASDYINDSVDKNKDRLLIHLAKESSKNIEVVKAFNEVLIDPYQDFTKPV